MPYIDRGVRARIDEKLMEFFKADIQDPGNLNYVITKILLNTQPEDYRDWNKLIGVLECVKLELYRKKISAYEDIKEALNGPI